MTTRELSKLQIRAEVLMILQQIGDVEDIGRADLEKFIFQLKSVTNQDDVLEILIKELGRADYKKGKVISSFLTNLGSLDNLKEPLWEYIKDPSSSDEIKDLANITLRSLGDTSDPEVFLNYLENPEEIIDKETKRLLETAIINPEAQIDFLDFLFSMPEQEQINLISSLKIDYSGDQLVNMLIPALDHKPSVRVEEALVEILGDARSPMAVAALTDYINYSNNDRIVKIAKKSLSQLKLSGIDLENAKYDYRGEAICRISKIYECYASGIDGIGSQGIIISRVKENDEVIMISTVINDIEGIVDCFGFFDITKSDFKKIISKFQENSTRLYVTPEYCKHRLLEAELINKSANTSIPYEYSAWKSLIYDIAELDESVEQTAAKWVRNEFIDQGSSLYKHPDMKHYFLEEDDHPVISDLLKNLINEIILRKSQYMQDNVKLSAILEKALTETIITVFDQNWLDVFKKRLFNIAYLLDTQTLSALRDIASTAAWRISTDCNLPIEEAPFLREMMRKTIYEGFLRHQYNIENQKNSGKISYWNNNKNSLTGDNSTSDMSAQDIGDIINIIDEMWYK